MNPDCFSTSGEQTKGRDSGMMHGGGEREEIEKSLALLEPFLLHRKWRKMVNRGGHVFFFSGFQ